MLIDVDFNQDLINESNARMTELYFGEDFYENLIFKSDENICTRIVQGIYYTGLNFNHDIKLFSTTKIKDDLESFSLIKRNGENIDWDYYKKCVESGMESKNNYGVCDNYEQVLNRYHELQDNDRRFVLALAKISKKHQPERDGWRWEKWGEYIGTQNSKASYLYDEPEIEYVYCYHIYEIQ